MTRTLDWSIELNNSNNDGVADFGHFLPTGFHFHDEDASAEFIYMAIRRPFKTPEDATKVFHSAVRSSGTETTGILADLQIFQKTSSGTPYWIDRQRGIFNLNSPAWQNQFYDQKLLRSDQGSSHSDDGGSDTAAVHIFGSYKHKVSGEASTLNFSRANNVFDIVTYDGNGTGQTVSHNLGATPELIIIKKFNGNTSQDWYAYSKTLGKGAYVRPNQRNGISYSTTVFNNTAPTSSVFSVGQNNDVNENGDDFVAYLWASSENVSHVGTYTGTGSNIDIDCNFTGDAVFVMIKCTSHPGDWVYFSDALGFNSSTSNYLKWNQSSNEATGTHLIQPISGGFRVKPGSDTYTNTNTSGNTYIYLAYSE